VKKRNRAMRVPHVRMQQIVDAAVRVFMRWMMQPETTDWSAQAEDSLNLLLRALSENNRKSAGL
jgi:hypothetical protein